MYACLAVTCHLHFWQNDRDFLRATVVTRGWNGYRNKSQHRKSTLEKKILPPFQQGFEPATFQSRVRCSNHWAIPAPGRCWCWSLLYSAILRSRADALRSHVILHEWLAFYSVFLNIHRSGVLNNADMAGATWNCCLLGAFSVQHTTMHHVTSCKATYVHACLAVTCHSCTFGRMTGIFYVLLR